MARKPNFTREKILNCAYEILIEESLKEVTARNIAKKLGASTISIYSTFSSMGELKNELAKKAKNKLFEYTKTHYTDLSLLNIGMGVCLFAREEKALFRTIFLRESLPKDFIDEVLLDFRKLIHSSFRTVDKYSQFTDETVDWIIKKGWLYTQGFATLICTGFYSNPSTEEIQAELLEMGTIILNQAFEINGGK